MNLKISCTSVEIVIICFSFLKMYYLKLYTADIRLHDFIHLDFLKQSPKLIYCIPVCFRYPCSTPSSEIKSGIPVCGEDNDKVLLLLPYPVCRYLKRSS